MKPMTPVVLDEGPGLDPGRGPGTGNAREIKEGTGQELEVGTTIERGNGMRGREIQIGPIGVEATERVARVGTQELEEVTVLYWKGWHPDLLHLARSNKQSPKRLKLQFMGFSLYLSLVLVVHASLISVTVLVLRLYSSSRSEYLRSYDTHLQDLYIMAIIPFYLIIYLHCSVSLSVCYLVLPDVCFSYLVSLPCLNLWTRRVLCQLYRYRCTTV